MCVQRSERTERLNPREYPPIPTKWGDPSENDIIFNIPPSDIELGVAELQTFEEREEKRRENWNRLAGKLWPRMWATPECRHHVKEYVMDAIISVFFASRKILPCSRLMIDGTNGPPLRFTKNLGRGNVEHLEPHMIAESDLAIFHWFIRGKVCFFLYFFLCSSDMF